MAKYPNITLTNGGINMIAESQGSGQLIFTSIKLGDGTTASGEDLKALTDLKNPLLIADISSIDDTTSAGQISLTAVINNANVTTGFFARELGIYAKIGTDGTEKLYAYTNAGNYADYMPDKNTPIDENKIKVTLVVGNASSVTAIINSSIVYTTIDEVNQAISTHDKNVSSHVEAFANHNADQAAHNVLITTHNTSNNAHADLLRLWQPGKEYDIGDIRYNHNLPSWAYLECVQAGTSGTDDTIFTNISNGG